MLYRFLINYFRLKLMRMLLTRLFGRKFSQLNALRVMSPKAYFFEWLASNLLKPAKKPKSPSSRR
jgi:hypothetical protein